MGPRLEPFVREFLVASGEPGETILRAAREREVDLIAPAIKRNSNHVSQLRSGVAYRVITGAECPVLTVR